MRRDVRLQPQIIVLGMTLLGMRPLYADATTATSRLGAPPAGDVAGAARAFEEGQRAQLRHDYDKAAELFELADRMAPSAAALRSAIRNHDAAGAASIAATEAAQALARYGDDADTRKFAEGVLARLAPMLGMLEIACEPACSVVIDERATASDAMTQQRLYVAPGEHAVAARWSDGRGERQRLTVAAGETQFVTLQPPPRVRLVTVATTAPGMSVVTTTAAAARKRRAAPYVTLIGAVVTLGLAGALVWSGIDTLAARDRYAGHATEAGYRDGVARERRTDGLIAGTAVAGAATLLIAAFATDWKHGFSGRLRHEARP